MNTHPMPRQPGIRSRRLCAVDTRRRSARERGYNHAWQRASEQYRRAHPLCVPCSLAGRVRESQCVDHIMPVHSFPAELWHKLFWDANNWGAMCNACHNRKTHKEPRQSWAPRSDRIVLCGLPGTGKTRWARGTGWPCWDADDWPALATIDEIRAAREAWINRQDGPCVVIVASLTTASLLAARIGGRVRHMTERFMARPLRAWS